MHTRIATREDFSALYKLGAETPEFKVSAIAPFMDEDEFMNAIENPMGVFLLAEEGKDIVGFLYANRQDPERAPDTSWVCLVYLVIRREYRKYGLAQRLYDACVAELKTDGTTTHLYGWANAESDGSMLGFFKKNGFSEGHKYVWMDKKL